MSSSSANPVQLHVKKTILGTVDRVNTTISEQVRELPERIKQFYSGDIDLQQWEAENGLPTLEWMNANGQRIGIAYDDVMEMVRFDIYHRTVRVIGEQTIEWRRY